jgi:predicted RNase H-like nuclease (RuvC/YqgF family)
VFFTSSPSSSSFKMPSSSYDILPNGISNDDYVIQNSSKKHDPQWAANASRGIISSHGNQLLEVQKLLQELTEHQDQILESIPLTEDAVLWASHTREFIEQVEKLPEYTKKAQAIEAEMQNLTKRIQRAKERVQKLNS